MAVLKKVTEHVLSMVFTLRKPGVDGCVFEGMTTQNRQTCGWSAGEKGVLEVISIFQL